MSEDNGGRVNRRIIRRRTGGMSFGRMEQSGGGHASGSNEDDELEEQVRDIAANHAVTQVVPDTLSPATSSPTGDDYNPATRMAQVARRSPEYVIEYRRQLVAKLMLRKVPVDEMAEQLRVSTRTVYNDIEEVMSRQREEARSMSVEDLLGDSTEFYDEAAAMAMRAASKRDLPMPMKLSAIRTALAARNDKHKFYQLAGVYDVLRFRPKDNQSNSDVRNLMLRTLEALNAPTKFSNDEDDKDGIVTI